MREYLNYADVFVAHCFALVRLIQWDQVMHICVSRLGHHWFGEWLVAWSAPRHYLNQCCLTVYWTIGDTPQIYFNQIRVIFVQPNKWISFSKCSSFCLCLSVLITHTELLYLCELYTNMLQCLTTEVLKDHRGFSSEWLTCGNLYLPDDIINLL